MEVLVNIYWEGNMSNSGSMKTIAEAVHLLAINDVSFDALISVVGNKVNRNETRTLKDDKREQSIHFKDGSVLYVIWAIASVTQEGAPND